MLLRLTASFLLGLSGCIPVQRHVQIGPEQLPTLGKRVAEEFRGDTLYVVPVAEDARPVRVKSLESVDIHRFTYRSVSQERRSVATASVREIHVRTGHYARTGALIGGAAALLGVIALSLRAAAAPESESEVLPREITMPIYTTVVGLFLIPAGAGVGALCGRGFQAETVYELVRPPPPSR